MAVRRLNHAVLYVHGLDQTVDFYRTTLGFEVRLEIPGRAAFLRAPGSNDQNMASGSSPLRPTPRPGRCALGRSTPAGPRPTANDAHYLVQLSRFGRINFSLAGPEVVTPLPGVAPYASQLAAAW